MPCTGNVIQNKIWYSRTDGTLANPGISFFSGRSTGFSLGSNVLNVSIQGTLESSVGNSLQIFGNVNSTGYLLGNGAGTLPSNPIVSNVQVSDSSYTILDDTAVSSESGGFVVINGSNFGSGTTVTLGGTQATSVTYVSSSRMQAQVPAKASGSYTVIVTRGDGQIATVPLGITYSPFPVWSTSAILANVTKTVAFTQTLSATEASNANVTYALSSGSTLPGNVSLASNGLLTGNIVYDPGNTTVYSFSIDAVDTQFQNIPRTFGLTALTSLIAATGGTITTSGAYKIHTFTTNGTFTVSTNPFNKTFDVLVVAGGGGGATSGGGEQVVMSKDRIPYRYLRTASSSEVVAVVAVVQVRVATVRIRLSFR